MPRTPDRSPGRLEEDEELFFDTASGAAPSEPGAMTYDPSTDLWLVRDSTATFDLLFGAQRFHAESLGSSTTTSQVAQVKVSITQTIPAGRYAVAWSMDLSCTAANRRVAADIFVDGTLRKETIARPTAANIPTTFGGLLEVVLLSGSRVFNLRWRANQGGTTAAVQRASLSVWRTA